MAAELERSLAQGAVAEGGEVEVRTQTADCGVTRAAREGGGVGKHNKAGEKSND